MPAPVSSEDSPSPPSLLEVCYLLYDGFGAHPSTLSGGGVVVLAPVMRSFLS